MKVLISIVILVLLNGCAQMQKDWEDSNCNYDGSFAAGVNDSKNGADMDPARIVSQCPSPTRADVQKGYRAGFMSHANSLVNLVDHLKSRPTSKRCVAKDDDVHSGFCSGMDKDECKTHSGVCAWR